MRINIIKLNNSVSKYERFLLKEVLSTKSNIIGLYGSREVGKTTMLF